MACPTYCLANQVQQQASTDRGRHASDTPAFAAMHTLYTHKHTCHKNRCGLGFFSYLALVLSLVAGMLRIWQMSGQELPAGSMEEISDVRELKASLRSLYSFPMCMQQLLHNGINLDNSTKLDAPIDLQLALSTNVQQAEAAKELADACKQGDLTVARLLAAFGSWRRRKRSGW